ncbi:cytochrome P450 [Roridomyces roridus]|uniref:Cytochrome P450 n=1 Tax=Roridomyces roridus TaxID=1738132 RepID=A0AAD7B4U5_9AGAR|nr:cytochrome P450 [Roridomyces roridus]
MPLFESPATVLCFTILAAAWLYAAVLRTQRRRLPLPPGPRQLPLVGNMFDVPLTTQWETYAKWSKECDSDIIHLNLAGTSVIVLNSLKATDDLLEKRSSIYSDRPDQPMVKDLMGWYFNIALMKYGDDWRAHRRLFNKAFNIQTARNYEPYELAGAHRLLKRFLHTPDKFAEHFRQMAGEIIMSVAYGIDVLPNDDPYIDLAHKAVYTFSIAFVPGLFLVDTFHILKHIPTWFPGAGFKRQAAEWRKLSEGMLEGPFAETKRQVEAGTARSSFAADSLHELKESQSQDSDSELYYEERHIKCAAGTMFIGGADTTVSALSTFVLAMLANPEAQRKAQAEIDFIFGGRGLPTFKDQDALPYVSALVHEVMRWEQVTPAAAPHLVTTEDEYRGYRIPKGSIVVGNAWAILHDEEMFPDPFTFNPDRFLHEPKSSPKIKALDAAFGFGRRLCPGRHMALSSIWITIASVLAVFDIAKGRDEEGNEIEPVHDYISGVICGPTPFKCSIKPRSRDAVALIEAVESSQM